MALHGTTWPVQYFLQLPRAADTTTLKTCPENMSEILETKVSARLHGVISRETTIFRFHSDRPVLWKESPVSISITEYHACGLLAGNESLPTVLWNV